MCIQKYLITQLTICIQQRWNRRWKLGNNSSDKVMLGVGSSYVVDEQGTNFYDNIAKDTPTIYEQKLEKQKNDINKKSNTN